YSPRGNDPGVGADKYAAKNPEFGATFTYNINTEFTSKKAARKKAEKEAKKDGKELTFPGYAALDAEASERKPKVWFTVKDANGEVVRKMSKPLKKGLQRTNWDLRYASTWPVRPGQSRGGWGGALAPPGKYTVSLAKEVNGKITELAGPVAFTVKPLHQPTLEGASPDEYIAYRKEVQAIQADMAAGEEMLDKLGDQIKAMEVALNQATVEPGALNEQLYALQDEVKELELQLEGSPSRDAVGEKAPPSVNDHFFAGYRGLSTTYGPTPNQRRSLGIAKDMVAEILPKIGALVDRLPGFQAQLREAGAPYIIGAELLKRRK
ncbi:MAG: glycosyl hydrolase, partial [Bacteroidota bacterium]